MQKPTHTPKVNVSELATKSYVYLGHRFSCACMGQIDIQRWSGEVLARLCLQHYNVMTFTETIRDDTLRKRPGLSPGFLPFVRGMFIRGIV